MRFFCRRGEHLEMIVSSHKFLVIGYEDKNERYYVESRSTRKLADALQVQMLKDYDKVVVAELLSIGEWKKGRLM